MRSKIISDIRFSFYLLNHPLNGFWDMKHEKKGRLWVAILYVVLFGFTNIFSHEVTGFLFNEEKYVPADIVKSFTQVFILFILVCLSNWSVTTLMDGKGTFKDIVMTFGYACLPYTLLNIPCAVISNFSSYSEAVYIRLFIAIGMIWFIALLFVGLMTVHGYTLGKMVLTTMISIVAAAVIVFIYLLFLSLITQMGTFIASLYKELSFRFR